MSRRTSSRALAAGCWLACCSLWGLWPAAGRLYGAPPHDPAVAGWQAIGRSGRGQSIYALTVGEGSRNVLVVAGLSGTEPSGPALADYFAAFLQRRPDAIAHARVTIVHTINPDGLTARTVFNRRGVELDRNFPTQGWVRGPATQSSLTGPTAGSEPETQLVLQLLAETQPELLIVLGGAPRSPRLSATIAAIDSARQVAQLARWPVAAWPAEQRPGALLSWAEERELPAVLVQLPFDRRTTAVWSDGVRALATLCDPQGAAEYERSLARPAPATVAARPATAERAAAGGSESARGGVLRYAELALRAPLARVALPEPLRTDRLAALRASSPATTAPVAAGAGPAAAGRPGQPAVQRLPTVEAEEFPTAIWQSPQTPIPAYPHTQTP